MEGHGFKVRLDHSFPEKWNADIRPRMNQIWGFVALGLRYLMWYLGMWFKGKKPFIDQFNPVSGKQIYGVPLGGIGSGTVGRGFRGEFTRFQMRPGIYDYSTASADLFIVSVRKSGAASSAADYQQVLSSVAAPSGGRLSGWRWDFPGSQASYRGLFPRSWTKYQLPDQPLTLTARQVSPVIPHNYKDTSLPCAVFVWEIANTGTEELDVSITFTFENGTGRKNSATNCSALSFGSEGDGGVSGMLIEQQIAGMPCHYAIAAREQEGVTVSRATFNPSGDGLDLWTQLAQTGTLTLQEAKKQSDVGVAVSARVAVPAGGSRCLELCLVWHMPEVQFTAEGRQARRYYTKWFDVGRQGAEQLAKYTLSNFQRWENEIDAWQDPVLRDPDLPDWYKSALFNELYYVSDGGSLWLRFPGEEELPETDPRREYGRFAYLESHEYIMYNTYDVHFYSSTALLQLWPQLQMALQYDMAEFVAQEDTTSRTVLYTGQMTQRKVANTVPHDVGNPGMPDEEPFCKLNSYQIHDVSAWKDLNLKFVLQVYRDWRVLSEPDHLRHLWHTCKAVMQVALGWDTDGDGMIENSGFPDQTYDTWVMQGVSAYCGGLWVASVYAMTEMARAMQDAEAAALYEGILPKAQKVYLDKLWTGSYYRFDCSASGHAQCIMSDQLCGHWYLRAAGVTQPVFSHVQTALRTVYDHNVLKFQGGRQGAVNGIMPDGSPNQRTMQSEETWTGVTYALAATMVHEGMLEEGFRTAEGIYRTVYERIGQGFETPEALYPEKHYRAVGYMRPLSIWAIQLAWQQRLKGAGDAV